MVVQLKEYIGIEQSKALVRLIPSSIVGMLLIGVLNAIVLSMHFPMEHLALWLSTVFVLVICQGTMVIQLKEYIGVKQAKALTYLVYLLLASMFLIGALSISFLNTNFSTEHLRVWLLSILILVFCRWWVGKDFTAESITVSNYRQYLNILTFWSFMNGISVASTAFLFHDPNASIYSLYLVCVLSGYISVASSSVALCLPVFFVFSIPAVSAFFLRFFMEYDGLYLPLAIAIIFYSLVVTMFARAAQNNFKASKNLEYENQSLLNQITEQKNRAERAIIEKNHFLAATSHDLSQPLHAMILYIEVLQSRLSDPQNTAILDKIAISGNALSDLLHGLLDISRLDASAIEHRPQHSSLLDLASRLQDEFSPQAIESKLQLIIEVKEEHIIYADPVLLERILRNLLSNAVKYTKQGHVKLSSTIVDSKVQVSVTDTGIGVAKEKTESIFSEFIQIENPERDRNKGLGLGLSIVKRLCDLQNIELIFESQLGRGTEVRLTLESGDIAMLPLTKKPMNDGFIQMNILFIDDEEDIRDSMEMIINSWKCRPIIAKDGSSALQAVHELNEKIDLIISDLRLPAEESGVAVIQTIREELNEEVPAIIVTGDTSVDRIELVKGAEAVSLIHKPVLPEKLRQEIERLLAKSKE